MIVKYFDINKNLLEEKKFFLFHGNNEGLKKEIIVKLTKNEKCSSYDEKEILENENIFLEEVLSKSLFEQKKIIKIQRCTDKIIKIFQILKNKEIEDILFILNSSALEKKSKLRVYFEKENEYVSVAFYPDNEQTLIKLAFNYLKQNQISVSNTNINFIVNKCNGDRENLFNELNKVEAFCRERKKITLEELSKLLNLSENFSISELSDNYLAKNKKKIINILNENNFEKEECITIIRTLLNKSKKLLKLSEHYANNDDIDLTISTAKPPIFWKDKEIVKKQIYNWSPENIKNLIYKLDELELQIKKNLNSSIFLTTDFILN